MALLAARTAPREPAKTGHPHPRWPVAVAAVLTFGTGALDVTTLNRLGGVFASVMTGNLAMTGLAFARSDATLLAHTGVGLAGYILGVAIGTWIAGRPAADGRLWPRSVTTALVVQLGVLVAFAAGWEATHGAPVGTAQLALLTVAAVSMGLQGAAMRGLRVAVTTTYLTGTLTGLVAAATRSPRAGTDHTAVAALIAAVSGAACGSAVLVVQPSAVPLLMLIPLAAVLAVAMRRRPRASSVPAAVGRPTRVVGQARSAVAAA